MLIEYIQQALRHATYEIMENGRFYGRIPDCPGTWGEGATLEECRDELQSVLESLSLKTSCKQIKFQAAIFCST